MESSAVVFQDICCWVGVIGVLQVRHQWRLAMLWEDMRSRHPAHYRSTMICPEGTDQSRLLFATQPVLLHVKLPHIKQQRHDKHACSLTPISPVCFLSISLVLHTSLSHLFPSVLLFFYKGTWQRETVLSQSTTWWRSVTLGCPVSKMTVSTPQMVASDKSLWNGRRLKHWTMVLYNYLYHAVTIRNISPVSLCNKQLETVTCS